MPQGPEIKKFLQKPKALIPTSDELGLHTTNPYLPPPKDVHSFKLPKNVPLRKLKDVADIIDLSELGVTIPRSQYPERFEAGFRYGLAHNARTDIKTHFRPQFSKGFCWAKMYYRKFNPNLPLAASGSGRWRIFAHSE